MKANVAAVNYHFGSREGLMDLLMMRLLEPLCEERLKALDLAERQSAGKMPSTEKIVSAYADALSATASRLEMGELDFFKLAGRILVLGNKLLPPPLATLQETLHERFLAALARALPDTPPGELAASWRIFDSGLSQALVTLTQNDDAKSLVSQWAAFGMRGFGGAKTAKETKQDDSQGMLFDF